MYEIYDGQRNFGLTARTNANRAVVYYALYDTDELLELGSKSEKKRLKYEFVYLIFINRFVFVLKRKF